MSNYSNYSDYIYENQFLNSEDINTFNSNPFEYDDMLSPISKGLKTIEEIFSKTTGITDNFVNEDKKENNNINIPEKNFLNQEKIEIIINKDEKSQFLNKKKKNTAIKTFSPDDMEDENIKQNEICQKQKRGRKSKNSDEIGKKTKYDFFNMLHKVKVIINKCIVCSINGFLKLEKKKKTIKKILGQITKDSSVNLNLYLFNSKIKDIISSKISCKFKKFNENYNEQVINDLLSNTSNEKIKTFLNLTYENFIHEVFLKFNESEFYNEFNFENNYLFKSINLEGKDQYYNMLINAKKQLENKKPRNRNEENYRKTFISHMMKNEAINLDENQ